MIALKASDKFTLWIAVSICLGIAVGYACHLAAPDAQDAKEIAIALLLLRCY